MNLNTYLPLAEKVAEVIDWVMSEQLKLIPPEFYELDNVGNRVALGASFNSMQMGRSMNLYESDDTVRRLRESLDGLPLVITHKQGLKYIIPLSGRPQLPKMVQLPDETRRNMVSIGVKHNGKLIARPWMQIGHIMVVGKTRSGKSNALRLFAYQALRDGFQLAIADNDRSTFPMLIDHPALIAPIAPDAETAYQLIERISAECDSRAATFQSIPGQFPETLEEYNALATAHGREPIKPILAIFDELSNTILISTARKRLTDLLGALGMRTLKFGIHIIFAAHEFTKEQIGLIRPQCETILAYRNEAKEMSALMGCAGAERIPQSHQGMVITNKWGRLQTYFLDKSKLGNGQAQSQSLPENETMLVKRSIAEADGKMTIPLLVQWGMREREARALVEEWELRGWLKQDAARGNARCVTPILADLVSNRQTGQTASNPDKPLSNRQQTPNVEGE